MRGMEQWIFPHEITRSLGEARSMRWQELTDYVATLEPTHVDSLAFSKLMIEACGCATCQPGGYRLSLGCETCSYRAVANLKECDDTLLTRFQRARREVERFLTSGGSRPSDA